MSHPRTGNCRTGTLANRGPAKFLSGLVHHERGSHARPVGFGASHSSSVTSRPGNRARGTRGLQRSRTTTPYSTHQPSDSVPSGTFAPVTKSGFVRLQGHDAPAA